MGFSSSSNSRDGNPDTGAIDRRDQPRRHHRQGHPPFVARVVGGHAGPGPVAASVSRARAGMHPRAVPLPSMPSSSSRVHALAADVDAKRVAENASACALCGRQHAARDWVEGFIGGVLRNVAPLDAHREARDSWARRACHPVVVVAQSYRMVAYLVPRRFDRVTPAKKARVWAARARQNLHCAGLVGPRGDATSANTPWVIPRRQPPQTWRLHAEALQCPWR